MTSGAGEDEGGRELELCHPAREGEFPEPDHLEHGLGYSTATALKTCVILVMLVNLGLFIMLMLKFYKNVPHAQVLNHATELSTLAILCGQIPKLVWVTSLFTVTSFVLTLLVFLPKSTEFLMAAFRVYEAMVISRFVVTNKKNSYSYRLSTIMNNNKDSWS